MTYVAAWQMTGAANGGFGCADWIGIRISLRATRSESYRGQSESGLGKHHGMPRRYKAMKGSASDTSTNCKGKGGVDRGFEWPRALFHLGEEQSALKCCEESDSQVGGIDDGGKLTVVWDALVNALSGYLKDDILQFNQSFDSIASL
jgi:hypothetical protein